MNRFLRSFMLFAIALILMFFLFGRPKDIEVTFQDAIESFNQYEMAVNGFVEQPTRDKIRDVSGYGAEFWNDYHDLTEHQTLFNKLFRVEPILTKQEIERLEDLNEMSEELDEKYVAAAFQGVFEATDFLVLLDEAKENGRYVSQHVDIQYSGKHEINIDLEGIFYADAEDSHNILTRYFIIETEQGNYYWEKPNNYSMSFEEQEVSIKIDKTRYIVKGDIRY